MSRWRRLISKQRPTLPTAIRHETLEPRVLLSADPAGAAAGAVMLPGFLDPDSHMPGDEGAGLNALLDAQVHRDPGVRSEAADCPPPPEPLPLDGLTGNPGQHEPGRELLLVDSATPDYQSLVDAFMASRDAATLDVVLIDAGSDGVSQITDALAGYRNLDTVHLVSHGDDGRLALGSGELNASTLDTYADQIRAWSEAFAEDGDLRIYGCDLAAGSDGRALVEAVARLTGADVAASVDLTGAGAGGGDFDLEYSVGAVDTRGGPDAAQLSGWSGQLALIEVTTTADVLGGDTSSISALLADPGADGLVSLREAVIASNNTAGADEILLDAQTYTLAIPGTGEGLSASGDLDIRDTLTITGVDASMTAINGAGLDRVLHVQTGEALTVSDLTVENGQAFTGAGLYMNGSSDVTLERVVVSNNSVTGNGSGAGIYNDGGTLLLRDTSVAANTVNGAFGTGGGLYNDGVAILERVTVEGNTAASGAGIYNTGTGLTLDNVTISGNSGPTSGAGIWTDAPLTATHLTLHANTADSNANLVGDGAGIWTARGADVTLHNSVLGDNLLAPGINTPQSFFSNDSAAASSLGGNVDADGTASLSQPSDSSGPAGVSLQLAALADNGGFTWTHAIGGGSTAKDHGIGAPVASDQRGVERLDASPDAGAFERNTAKILPAVDTGGTAVYIENAAPVRIDVNAALADPDTANFNGGSLTVDFVANGTAADRLGVLDQGAGPGRITTDLSDNVYFDFGAGAVLIGSFTGGTSDVDPLLVSFNANANRLAVQSLMRAVTFETVDDMPSTATRTLSFTVDDGDAGIGNTDTADVQVVASNDAPVLDDSIPANSETTFIEGAGPVVIDPGMSVTEPDGPSVDFDGGKLTVQFLSGNDPGDLLSVRDEGTAPGQVSVSGTTVLYNPGTGAVAVGTLSGGTDATGPLIITFNAAADEAAVQAVARNVTFDNSSVVPAENERTVEFLLTDRDGGTSNKEAVDVEFVAERVLWLSAKGSESPSDALGGATSWLSGDVVEFGGGATLETGPGTTTGGPFANQFSFTGVNQTSFAAEQADLRALHYVRTILTLGTGGDTYDLKPGDLIAAVDNVDTLRLTSSNTSFIDVDRQDLFVFTPDLPGDYTAGTFTKLLDNPFGRNIHAITLVEKSTHLGAPEGGSVNKLDAGDFLVAYSSPGDHDDVFKFTAAKVVTATDVGTPTKMLEGSLLGFTDQVQGLDLVEQDVTLGDTTLNMRQLLMTLDKDQFGVGNGVGSNDLSVRAQDVFVLDITATEASGVGNTAATATLLFEGSDVALGESGNPTQDGNETFDGLTLARLGSYNGNAAPSADIASASYSFNENSTLDLIGQITAADPDAGAGTVKVTLAVDEGTLSVDPDTPTTGVSATGSGTGSVELTGTLAQINSMLAGSGSAALGYGAVDAPAASATLTVTIDDQGNTGGSPMTGSDTATLNITADNDGPAAVIAPADYAVNENSTLTLHGTGLSVSDADAGGGAVRATLSVGEGVLTVSAGTTGVTVAGSGSASVTLDGTLAQINALLAGSNGATAVYDAIDTPAASTTFTLAIDDLGNSGAGGAMTANDTATLTITADNDGPGAVITPAGYAVSENSTLTLHGTGLSVSDPDAAGTAVRTTLSVGEGVLSVGAGTTGVTVSGSGTASVTLDGTLAQINALLAGTNGGTAVYDAVDTPAASTTFTLAINDLGNSGAGGAMSSNDTATLTITADNDGPGAVITPADYAVNENSTLTLHGTGLSVSDADAGGAAVRATLSVGEGVLSVGAGTTGVTVSGSGTASVTLDGTLAQINALLAGSNGATAVYDAIDTPAASTTLTLAIDDLGNSGAGGALSANDTATLTITADNDGPSAVITPGVYAVNENSTLTLHGTGLSVSDADAGGGAVRATLSVGEGVLTVSAGTTGVTVAGSGTASVTLDGTLAQINALLAGSNGATAVYDAIDTPAASTIFTLAIDDLGNSGAGGAMTANDTATLTITADNDGPSAVITPGGYAVNENTTLTLHGTGLSVSDPDAAGAALRATLSVGEGVLSVGAGTTGVTVSGSGTASVTLDGTLTQINALLAGTNGGTAVYDAVDAPAASTTFTLAINDLGNSGAGGAMSSNDTATLTITADNDGPGAVITPAGYAVNENTTLTLHGTGLSVSDPDAGGAAVRATLSVGEGVLSVGAGTTGVTVSGSGTASVTLDGTLAQINALLAGTNGGTATYDAIDAPSASTLLTLGIDDLGNTGAGGALSASDTATLTITADNDGPSAVITPAGYAANDNTSLTLHGTGLSVSDPDAAGTAVRATLSVGEGVLGVGAGTTGVTVSGSGTASVTLDGTLAQINALLAGTNGATAVYDAITTPSASTLLTLGIDDLGNTGAGGALSASDTATVTISADNDGPTAVITPAGYAVNETTTLILHGTGLSVSDPDAGGAAVRATLSVGEGVLTVGAGATGVTVTGSGTGTVTLDGTIAQINALLGGAAGGSVVYDAVDAPAASTLLSLGIDDLGNSGAGGPLTGSDTALLTIAAVNDAPSADITPAAYAMSENVPLALHGTGLSVSDPDAGTAAVRATLTVGEGAVSVSAGGTGVSVSGSGTGAVTLDGTLAQINALLAGAGGGSMFYLAVDTPGPATALTLSINDLGNTGTGGALTDADAAVIAIAAVNDAPVADAGAASRDVDAVVSYALHGTGMSVGDVDAGGAAIQAVLSVGEGVLDVSAGATGVSVLGSGTTTVTLNGSVAGINQLLLGGGGASVVYEAAGTPSDMTALTLTVNDLGNSGSGGPLAASAGTTLSITKPAADPATPPGSGAPTTGADTSPPAAPAVVGEPPADAPAPTPATAAPPAEPAAEPAARVAADVPVLEPAPVVEEDASSRGGDAPAGGARAPAAASLLLELLAQRAPDNVLVLETSDRESPPVEEFPTALVESLDALREDVREEASLEDTVIVSSVTVSSSLSVGYVVWLIRGGTLLSTLLSSMPAWRTVDPLPVLGRLDDEDDEDDEELDGDLQDRDLEELVDVANRTAMSGDLESPAEMRR